MIKAISINPSFCIFFYDSKILSTYFEEDPALEVSDFAKFTNNFEKLDYFTKLNLAKVPPSLPFTSV